MLRGIRFTVDSLSTVLRVLSELIDIDRYDWVIDDLENNYIAPHMVSVKDDLSSLRFARVRRYPLGAETGSIDTYDDFVDNSCQTLILFYNGGFCDIYEKDEDLVRSMYEGFSKVHVEKLAYIGEDDPRNYMHF